MLSFIARDEAMCISKLSEYNHVKDYLYGSLYQWRVFTDELSQQEIVVLVRLISMCEEVLNVNMVESGDIKVDGGWIRSALKQSYIEEVSNDDPISDLSTLSPHERRLVSEIADAYSLDLDSNAFTPDQSKYYHEGTPRKMMLRILISIINSGSTTLRNANHDTPKSYLYGDDTIDSIKDLLADFTIRSSCGESETIDGDVCKVTLSLLSEDISITRYYHNLKKKVQPLVDDKSIITSWALFYYATTNRLSISSLPILISE